METPEQQIANKRGPISWMAGRSVTANLLMLVLLIGGFVMAQNIGKEVFPDFELDLVTISLIYPGASPEEVERGTILAVEEAIQDIEGIKEITATVREGSGTVVVEVIEGEDTSEVAQGLRCRAASAMWYPWPSMVTSPKRFCGKWQRWSGTVFLWIPVFPSWSFPVSGIMK
jgi:hypothetical protein